MSSNYLVVTSLADFWPAVDEQGIEYAISLVYPSSRAVRPPGWRPEQQLRLEFHDIAAAQAGMVPPSQSAIAALIRFSEAQTHCEKLLLHCYYGISRSTAAALIVMCSGPGAWRPKAAAEELRRVAPQASPNRLMLALADDYLGLRGELASVHAGFGPADSSRGRRFRIARRPAHEAQRLKNAVF